MTPDEINLLSAVAARSHAAFSAPEPFGFGVGLARAGWIEDQELGPRLPTAEVFGSTDAGRKRGQRTLKKLEAAGYIKVWRPAGVAVRAKITDAGRVVLQHVGDGAGMRQLVQPILPGRQSVDEASGGPASLAEAPTDAG